MSSETTVPDVAGGPASAAVALAIRWVFPGTDGSITRLETGEIHFGRDASCAGYLPSASVSRRHAAIRWTPGGVPMLRDLGSTNGVFVNGQRVRQAPLRPRDVLRVGDFIGVLVRLPADHPTAWSFEELTKGYFTGPSLRAALEPARLVAATDLPIVIEAETGAGKEGAARAIAAWSGRPGPFVAINCAALPEAMAEGELFGYRRGAFSGAERAHPGFLRAAQGGTLLLDEIAELSLPIQAKLLRAIELREVVPLGESTPVGLDLRVLAAAQRPLRQAVDEKRFRGDLLARLDGLTIRLPPLRERVEEIPYLFAKLVEQHRGAAAPPRLDPVLLEHLCAHDWPFNVRELALLVRRLLALHPEAAVLDHSMLRGMLATQLPEPRRGVSPALPRAIDDPPAAAAETEVEAREARPADPEPGALLAALRAEHGNVRRAAAALGISRGRLYRSMEKLSTVDLAALRSSFSRTDRRP